MVRPIPRNAPSIEAYGSILLLLELWHTTLDLTAGPVTFRTWGIPLATTTVVVAELLGRERTTSCSCSSFFASGTEVPTVGNSRYKQLDRRGPALLLFHRGAVRSEKQGMSWAVPSSGVKCDAVPGRLNQISISVQREGVYYDRPTAEPTLAQPHHPGCEPPEKQAITASGWSSMEPRSKAVDKIEEGVRLPVEQRIRFRITNLKRGARASGERVVMRRGPVQDRTVPLQRQQTLSTARRHSLSELFQLLHDFVPR
ncbi:hypothetical protein L1987_88566 [Smallanthus sonchifolius]|nr:hypothetical protein L1987_88566 [Smallanthus sonchifolius]